jgi:hypothetical protein
MRFLLGAKILRFAPCGQLRVKCGHHIQCSLRVDVRNQPRTRATTALYQSDDRDFLRAATRLAFFAALARFAANVGFVKPKKRAAKRPP